MEDRHVSASDISAFFFAAARNCFLRPTPQPRTVFFLKKMYLGQRRVAVAGRRGVRAASPITLFSISVMDVLVMDILVMDILGTDMRGS